MRAGFMRSNVKLEWPPGGAADGVPRSDASRRSARSAGWAHGAGLGDHGDGPPTKRHHCTAAATHRHARPVNEATGCAGCGHKTADAAEHPCPPDTTRRKTTGTADRPHPRKAASRRWNFDGERSRLRQPVHNRGCPPPRPAQRSPDPTDGWIPAISPLRSEAVIRNCDCRRTAHGGGPTFKVRGAARRFIAQRPSDRRERLDRRVRFHLLTPTTGRRERLLKEGHKTTHLRER